IERRQHRLGDPFLSPDAFARIVGGRHVQCAFHPYQLVVAVDVTCPQDAQSTHQPLASDFFKQGGFCHGRLHSIENNVSPGRVKLRELLSQCQLPSRSRLFGPNKDSRNVPAQPTDSILTFCSRRALFTPNTRCPGAPSTEVFSARASTSNASLSSFRT